MSASQNSFQEGRRGNEPRRQVEAGTGTHGIAPREEHRMDSMDKSRGTLTGNVHGGSANNVRVTPQRNFSGNLRNNFRGETTRAPAFDLTTAEWNIRSAGAIGAHMRKEGLSLKELAYKIGCNDRTAENYVQGRTSPGSIHFLRCLAVIPEFATEVQRVSVMLTDNDPRATYAAAELLRAAQRFLDARDRTNETRNDGYPQGPSGDGGQLSGGDDEVAVGDLFAGAVP